MLLSAVISVMISPSVFSCHCLIVDVLMIGQPAPACGAGVCAGIRPRG
jgi:hypothetical protein